MKRPLILLVAVLMVAAMATPAAAASEIHVDATLNGESISGENASIIGLAMDGSLIPKQVQTLEGGSTVFTGLAPGRYFVTVQHEDTSLRQRTTLQANTSTSLNIRAGSSITGTVVDRETGEPVPNVNVSLRDFFGTASSTVTDENGTFEISPVVLDVNYTASAEHGGFDFDTRVTSGDDVTLRVAEPITSDENIEYRATNGSQLHAGRMAVIDFDSVPVRLTDYYSAYNPSDRPFSGQLTIQKTRGADVAGVNDINGNQVPFTIENGTIYVNTTIPANDATPIGVRYALPGSSVELTADRYTESALLLIASSNAELEHLETIGPLSLEQYSQPINTIRFTATGSEVEKGTTFGVTIDRDAAPAPTSGTGTGSGTDGSGNTEIVIAVVAALAVVAVLLVSRRGDIAGGDGESLTDRIGSALKNTGGTGAETSGSTACPECGTETPGQFCPSCGAKAAGTCSGCGQEVGADVTFCPNCGQEQ